MTVTDWEVLNPTNGGLVGGVTGSTAANSPLALQGSAARGFVNVAGPDLSNLTIFFLDSTLHPVFDAIPDTRAVRVEAWIKCGGYSPGAPAAEEEISVRTKIGLAGGAASLQRSQGYGFGIYSSSPSHGGLAADFQFRAGDKVGNSVSLFTGTPAYRDTWYQVRMDVIPTLNGATVDRDTIRCYINTGTEASPVWTLEYSTVVLDSESTKWIPWGDADAGGVGFGFYVKSGSATYGSVTAYAYIDGFKAYVKDK